MPNSFFPQGQRHDDPPQEGIPSLKFRLALAAHKYPVQIALIVALIPVSILAGFVVSQQIELRHQQHATSKEADQIASLLTVIQENRASASFIFCNQVNGQAAALNRLNETLQGIILNSVQQSRPFERVYRQFGLPPYKERVKQAQKIADSLAARRVGLLPCAQEAAEILRTAPRPPNPPVP